MSYERIKVRCEKADQNNGTNSLTWIKPSEFADVKSRQNIFWASLEKEHGPFEVGKDYWIEIYPA